MFIARKRDHNELIAVFSIYLRCPTKWRSKAEKSQIQWVSIAMYDYRRVGKDRFNLLDFESCSCGPKDQL